MDAELTSWLRAWRAGDAEAGERAVALLYPRLHALAQRQLAGERAQHTLQPTALVNEAWMRLSALHGLHWQDRLHFVRMAAKLMREVLVDHARRRLAAKRDGGERITLDGLALSTGDPDPEVLALEEALARLERLDPARAAVVELRWFGGLGVEETAEALGVSPATVKRQWQAARLWLYAALSQDGSSPPG